MSGLYHTTTNQIVVFTLDEQSYALSLPSVIKVIHSVEVRPLPKAPEIIAGIINVKGQIIPVADIRTRFGLTAHEIDLNDQFIIANTGKRDVAIVVDAVSGIRDLEPHQMDIAEKSLPFAEHIQGIAKVDDSLVLIYDLERFLSLDEEKVLEQALNLKTDEA